MTIDQAIYDHVKALGFNIFFGSAEGVSMPYYTMIKISDAERPDVLCEAQGESGQAVFIFEGHAGGQGQAGSASSTLTYTQLLHDAVKNIKGLIGTAPNEFRIWNNTTNGVVLSNRAAQSLSIWSSEFSVVFWWSAV